MNTKLRAARDTIGQIAMIFIIASVITYLSTFLTIQIVTYLGVGFAIGMFGYLMYSWNLTTIEMREKFGDKSKT
jgi:ABC-type antimicrobial peptide transport system permease subunit